jgi:M6 family metalloprotease-like protein
MKTFISLLSFLSILFLSEIYSQTDDFKCGLSDNPKEQGLIQTGSLYKPVMNAPGQYFRVLVVFVQFSGDIRPNTGWPLNQLPVWANSYIASSPSSSYNDLTVSDYWKQMSQGNYDFIGNVYPNLVTLPPESYYQQNNYNWTQCNQDVLAAIDPNVNFNDYDKWSYNTQTQSFQFTPEGFVDMIYIIYRDPGTWFTISSDPQTTNFTAIANLCDIDHQFDYATGEQGKTVRARYYPTKESTGITFRKGLSGHVSILGTSAHEFGHYIFGSVHWNAGAGGIMGGYTFAMSGWERERVGYIAYTDVTQDNFTAVLGDFISEGDILRVPVSSSNYFLVENHQRLSHYDQIKQGGTNPGFQWNTLGAGIYIWKVTNGASSSPTFDMVTADGRFDWEYVGDFWAGPGFYVGYPWEGWVPKTKRMSVNRNGGKTDRYPLHIYWNNHWANKWCDTDGYGNWWLSRNVMGNETDAFNLGYNEIFSNWSNPSSYHNTTTNIALQVYSKNGTNITVKAYTTSTSAQNLPPSKPTFLQIGISQNDHPYLTWAANLEPDLNYYRVEKYVTYEMGWQFLIQTANNYYEDLSETVCNPPPGQNCGSSHWVRYRIKAYDTQALTSLPSDSAMINVNGGMPDKINLGTPKVDVTEYSLSQNYPNPFNPTTTISYTLKKDGVVQLRVFDILGKVVAELVNGRESAGTYSVAFNSNNLPSGIYFYQLNTGGFIDTKKMILLK